MCLGRWSRVSWRRRGSLSSQWFQEDGGASCNRYPAGKAVVSLPSGQNTAANPEISGQRCLVFEVDGLTVWLPKFELARKMFFHAAFIVRSLRTEWLAIVGLITGERDAVHIHTPWKHKLVSLPKIGLLHNHFSWLLLNQDVRRSFESIWQSPNQQE